MAGCHHLSLSRLGKRCGEFAKGYGVEIRLEIHGHHTCEVPNARAILDFASHPNVFVCWNSNPQDVDATGSIAANYNLVRSRIRLVHITDLVNAYPWRNLFARLAADAYQGFTLAEVGQPSCEPERFMSYYRALWQAYQPGR